MAIDPSKLTEYFGRLLLVVGSTHRKIGAPGGCVSPWTGQIGSNAKQAVTALTNLLEDTNETARAAAADALGRIGVPERSVIFGLLAPSRLSIH